jgi:hypothetical protein
MLIDYGRFESEVDIVMSHSALNFAASVVAMTGLLLAGCGKPEAAKPAPAPAGPGAVSPAAPRGFQLVVEVESGEMVAPFAVATEAETSGGKCVRLPVIGKDEKTAAWLDPKAAAGMVTLTVDVPRAGKAWVWFRTYWRGGCSNSFHLQYPGGKRTVGEDGTYGCWHWVKGPVGIPLAAGPQAFVISVREDDIGLDQMIVTTDPEFVPQGIETPPVGQ